MIFWRRRCDYLGKAGIFCEVEFGPNFNIDIMWGVNFLFFGLFSVIDAQDRCFKACNYNYEPVCGSDNVNYDNRCLFDIANCNSGMKLKVVKEGLCPSYGK